MRFSFLVFDSETRCYPGFCLSLHIQFDQGPWIVCLSLHIQKCWDIISGDLDQVISSRSDAGLHASKVFLPIHSCIFLLCAHQRVSCGSQPRIWLSYPQNRPHVRPLWIARQRDTDTAAGELERYSVPKDLALQGGCSHVDIYIYLCLFVFTLVLLHMKWHIFAYVPTPGSSSNHIYIRIYS